MYNNKHVIRKFNSINSFIRYLNNSKSNGMFEGKEQSIEKDEHAIKFTGTESLDEALMLFKTGDDSITEKINIGLKLSKQKPVQERYYKSVYDVCGFQANVPRYLQGIPTNMVNKKAYMKTKPVIVLNILLSFSAKIKTWEIIKKCVENVKLVQDIEAKGTRIELNVLMGGMDSHYKDGDGYLCKICLKKSTETLNIRKLSFALCHPSMLRRVFFRALEVDEVIFCGYLKSYTYGLPVKDRNYKIVKEACKGEYLLPTFYENNIDSFDLEKLLIK